MAENKKSVLLYCDIIHTVSKLNDEQAGKLFKHYLKYINDQNPEAPDPLTEIVFEPIKQNLKRDLKKWEQKSQRNSESAKARWNMQNNANASERIIIDAKHADKDTVKVKDTVTVKVKEKVIINKDYQLSVDFWLKEFRIGWTFGGVQGKALKSILKKIDTYLTNSLRAENDCFEFFKLICLKLPPWFQDKDLSVIDSKLNEIITQIKNKNNGTVSTSQSIFRKPPGFNNQSN